MVSVRSAVRASALAAALFLSGGAQAGVIAFGGNGYEGTASGQGRLFTGDDGTRVRVTAWSRDNNSDIQASSLGVWDQGLGVNTARDNSHTVDNSGWGDFLLFQFDKSVALDKAAFQTGWHGSSDTDAFIGVDDLSFSFTAQPAWDDRDFDATLAGFKPLYSSGSAGNSGNNTRGINPAGLSGNAWLIGAALPVGSNPFGPDHKYDGFKLKGLSYSAGSPGTPVPEPASWALLLAAFGFLGLVRRRPKPARAHLTA